MSIQYWTGIQSPVPRRPASGRDKGTNNPLWSVPVGTLGPTVTGYEAARLDCRGLPRRIDRGRPAAGREKVSGRDAMRRSGDPGGGNARSSMFELAFQMRAPEIPTSPWESHQDRLMRPPRTYEAAIAALKAAQRDGRLHRIAQEPRSQVTRYVALGDLRRAYRGSEGLSGIE